MGPLLFRSLYQERVWGGRALESAFRRRLPAGKLIGESWEVVDRPEAQSVVARGGLAGRTLRELLALEPEAIMGPGWDARRPFPILTKWLDCRLRLSLQVHPPEGPAALLGGEPKSECWYIAEAAPEAALIVGLRRGVKRTDFERAVERGTLEACLHRFPVRAGDSILVCSGRLHAIDAGCLILEIQQNSDTTYRVYDWGRNGLDGKPRRLHVEESLACIDFEDFEPRPRAAAEGDALLADCREFRIRKLNRRSGEAFPRREPAEPSLLHVIEGEVAVIGAAGRDVFRRGDNVLLPAICESDLLAESDAAVLVTDRFGNSK